MNPILALVLLSFGVFGSTLSCVKLDEKLINTIDETIRATYPKVAFETLKISDISKQSDLDCDKAKFEFPKKVNFTDDIVIKLDLYKKNEFIRRKTSIFRVSGWANILRANSDFYNGDLVTRKTFYSDTIPISQVTHHTISLVSDDGIQFRNYLGKDQMLESWMIEKIPDIKKGEIVKSIIKNENITLTLDGRVLENGHIGSKIKLKLNDKVFIGKLENEKTVLVLNN